MKTPDPPKSSVGVKVCPIVTEAAAGPAAAASRPAKATIAASEKRVGFPPLIGLTVSAAPSLRAPLHGRPTEPETQHALPRQTLHALDVDVHPLSVRPRDRRAGRGVEGVGGDVVGARHDEADN